MKPVLGGMLLVLSLYGGYLVLSTFSIWLDRDANWFVPRDQVSALYAGLIEDPERDARMAAWSDMVADAYRREDLPLLNAYLVGAARILSGDEGVDIAGEAERRRDRPDVISDAQALREASVNRLSFDVRALYGNDPRVLLALVTQTPASPLVNALSQPARIRIREAATLAAGDDAPGLARAARLAEARTGLACIAAQGADGDLDACDLPALLLAQTAILPPEVSAEADAAWPYMLGATLFSVLRAQDRLTPGLKASLSRDTTGALNRGCARRTVRLTSEPSADDLRDQAETLLDECLPAAARRHLKRDSIRMAMLWTGATPHTAMQLVELIDSRSDLRTASLLAESEGEALQVLVHHYGERLLDRLSATPVPTWEFTVLSVLSLACSLLILGLAAWLFL